MALGILGKTMLTRILFVNLLLVAVACGGDFEKERSNVNHETTLGNNCTLKNVRVSSSNDLTQGAAPLNSRNGFSNLRNIKHNYFLVKNHHDQTARPSGCPPCCKYFLGFRFTEKLK